jgi:hypothetical protein
MTATSSRNILLAAMIACAAIDFPATAAAADGASTDVFVGGNQCGLTPPTSCQPSQANFTQPPQANATKASFTPNPNPCPGLTAKLDVDGKPIGPGQVLPLTPGRTPTT